MRIAATLLGAICYALALPPFDQPALGWIALAPLLVAVHGTSAGSAFRLGLLYGYAFGWAATWPFAEAVVRYFDLSLPLAVTAMGAWYLIIVGVPFGAFAAGSASLLRTRPRGAVLLIPALYVATELLRGRGFGQPWALLGYTQHTLVPVIQVASVTGVFGVSFLLALSSAALANAWLRRGLLPVGMTAASVLALVAASVTLPPDDPDGTHARRIALVQTGVPPARHWNRTYTARQIASHVRATDAIPASERPRLIVWPESAVPRYLEAEPMLAATLAQVAKRHDADLLFGSPRTDGNVVHNSARLLTAAGRNGGIYDKRRLVWFAEDHLSHRASGVSDSPEEFAPGTTSGVLASVDALGVSICHEIVHPDLVASTVADGAELLVNIANDGWLDSGVQTARAQHLAMARFRAVETRRWVLRAATSGPSAVIDPHGRIIASLGVDQQGVVLGTVAPRSERTLYVRFGDLFAGLCTAAALLGILGIPARLRPAR